MKGVGTRKEQNLAHSLNRRLSIRARALSARDAARKEAGGRADKVSQAMLRNQSKVSRHLWEKPGDHGHCVSDTRHAQQEARPESGRRARKPRSFQQDQIRTVPAAHREAERCKADSGRRTDTGLGH